MKTSFRQFVADMNRKHDFRRRLLSVLCILSLLVSGGVSMLLMVPGMTASLDPLPDNGIIELLTDNPTHNGWIDYFGVHDNSYSTEFAGGVWMDKSVFTEYTSTKGAHITAKNGNMLGVLSAIGSSQAVTGRIYSPTDVMLILDMSSSMYSGSTKSPTTVQAMVNAVNNSIATLLSLNEFNRVGVTVYYGGATVTTQSNAGHGYVLMPLDRYTASNGTYITANINSSNKLTSVKVTNGVTTESGGAVGGTVGHTLADIAGTYAQVGILHALKEFMEVPDEELTVNMLEQEIDRQPIFIFMSDGEPTAATTDFTNINANAQFGNNQVASRSPNETDFVTQLTAAYAKEQVGNHYYKDPLFYTLALGTSISLSVMDPSNNTTNTINNYWSSLVNNGSVTFTSAVYQANWTKPTLSFTVNKAGSFPSNVNQRLYVDKYFSAKDSSQLANAFETIVNEIIIKSIYNPTLVTLNNVNQSGEVSFVDHIGEYMSVIDMRGILIGGELYTGASLAAHFSSESGSAGMGTLDSPTDLGWAFHMNVLEQLGLDNVYNLEVDTQNQTISDITYEKTTELIQAAYAAGQLAYTDASNFSNYIGWYADSKDGYLGFWDGTENYSQEMIDLGATQVIKSYFYQGVANSEDHYTLDTDMMYATVWVKEDIATKQETVVFSVPASLLPTLKYFVKLSPDGTLVDFHLGAVDHDAYDGIRPIRLVYEVGLDPDITEENLLDMVDATYLQNNRDPETGKVYFYSNAWERDLTTGYNKVNTYGYFRPSTVNDRYYYTADAPMYLRVGENQYEPYTGTKPTSELEIYTQHIRYVRDLTNTDANYVGVKEYFYMPATTSAMDAAQQNGSLQWYVPAGTAHNLDVAGVTRFASYKTTDQEYHPEGDPSWQNITGTLNIVNEPFADDGSRGNITAHNYVMGASLGNNGRVALVPDGQLLQKKLVTLDQEGNLVPYEAETDQSFQFLIHEGEALTGVDYSDPTAVAEALGSKKVSLITLTVITGNSATGVQPLTNLTEYTVLNGNWEAKSKETPLWSCVYTHTYTVVELNTNGRFDLHILGETKVPAGSAKSDETEILSQGGAIYQFVYGSYPEGDSDHLIVASNQFAPWQIQLTKIDSERTGVLLPGAIFGIYSPKEAEGMTELPSGYTGFDLTTTYNEKTWYLTQISTTDENGLIVWEGLTQEEYVVVELQPPPGYFDPAEAAKSTLVQRSVSPDLRITYMTISNTPGYEMPSTGGSGPLVYIFIGSAIMAITGSLLIVYHTKRKEEHDTDI